MITRPVPAPATEALAPTDTFPRRHIGPDEAEVQEMLGGNAARLYRFDMARLAEVAARVGPTHEEIDRALPVEEIPAEAMRCPAFAG